MQILITNDDGIESPGLWALAAALQGAGYGRVTIIAPAEEHSGMGMSFPPRRSHRLFPVAPLDPAHAGITAFAYEGTPVGCVTAGMLAGACPPPDVVVSGINYGLNGGTNVMLSGTVGAAMAAALWGLPAMAVSLQYVGSQPMTWGSAAWAAARLFPLVRDARARWGAAPMVLNVNVPRAERVDDIKGFRQTRLSQFFYGAFLDAHEHAEDERGGQTFSYRFVRERVPTFDADSDDGAVRAGYVSVTPLAPLAVREDVLLADDLAGLGG